jgi:hypothetical protein
MYSTHAFPEWGSITPEVDDNDRDYVQKTSRALKDIFGENQELDRPEYDAPTFAKPRTVRAARAVCNQTENQTLDELCSLVSERSEELAEERGVSGLEVTPRVLAVAGYADTVRSLSWGTDQLGEMWTENALVLVADNLHNLEEMGKRR